MKRSRGQLLLAGLAVLALGLGGLFFLFKSAEDKLSALVLGGLGEGFSTKIYSAPLVLHDRFRPRPEGLMRRLDRRGYVRVPGLPKAPGQYAWFEPFITVQVRPFRTPSLSQKPGTYTLIWKEGEPWTIRESSGEAAGMVAFEPELIAELSGSLRLRREPARSEDIPQALKLAVVDTEDKRFYRHWGVDPRGIARSLRDYLLGGKRLGGGSTLTQQLAKNYFLSPKRSFTRKAQEALLALFLEFRYDKDGLLTLYLNHIYLGQDGPVSVAGVRAAARFYFDKETKELSLSESALLAGLIRSPWRYNPRRDLDLARDRRDHVLRRMREEGHIGDNELAAALAEPIHLAAHTPGEGVFQEYSYFVAEAVRHLLPRYGEESLFRLGLSVYTTMDPELQKAAQRALAGKPTQGALAAVDPYTGSVLALAGGTDYAKSQFNRATQALRQPGSAFKPFVYGAAIEAGWTPASVLEDQPKSYPGLAGVWNPKNYGEVYLGTTTVREALAHSLNAATLELAQKLGIPKVQAYARRMGIKSPLENSLALALGDSELSLLELTGAYAPFVNGGWRVEPEVVSAVYDAQGRLLEKAPFERTFALEPAKAYLMTSLLRSTVEEGTARALGKAGWTRPAAGKTGTSNQGRDAWFIGYTPQIAAGAWAGDDRRQARNLTGAKNALPIWAAFMNDAMRDYPPEDFEQPSGVVKVELDPASGLLAGPNCPSRREESFLAGTEPKAPCPLHPVPPPAKKSWLRHLFGG